MRGGSIFDGPEWRHLWNKTRAAVAKDSSPEDPEKTLTLEVRPEEVKVLYAKALALQSLVDGWLDPREIEYLYVFMSRVNMSSDSREEVRQTLATLAIEAGRYLSATGLDPDTDPLLQVLSQTETSEINRRYKHAFEDIGWDQSDYLAILLAGFVATLLDVFLVRIPLDGAFLGRMQAGSPMTRWIRENSNSVHDHYLKDLENAAKIPYDLSAGRAVDGLSPKVHRLMSLGHDPVLAFIFGTIDIMSGTGTYVDKHGDLRRIATSLSPEDLIVAFLKVFPHLLSDVFTTAGIQPPFFTLLQLAKTKSPFVLGPSGEKVSWTNVARYMYTHGYDLRHFATMGIVPASIEMIVRGWWLCKSFESGGKVAPTKAKLTSMLMLSHLIATSGNLLKTGVIFGMNPLALNWAQLLALPPVTLAWIIESLKRNRSIRVKLDEEWKSTFQAVPWTLA